MKRFLKQLWNMKKGKPKCFRPQECKYPLCIGGRYPQEFAENDCIHCNLYKATELYD